MHVAHIGLAPSGEGRRLRKGGTGLVEEIKDPGKRKVIRLAARREPELTEQLIHDKIVKGEAEFVGSIERNGRVCEYYKLVYNHKVTFVFNVKT